MNESNKETLDTQESLLNAAGEIFAEKGFRQTTIREICQKAGTNIAAVNYHFGGKEELYKAVMRHWFLVARDKFPLIQAVEEKKTPEEKLYTFIWMLLHRMLGTGAPAWHGKLMAMELAEPTSVINDLFEIVVKPQMILLHSIVKELLGNRDDHDTIMMYANSIVGQCLFYRHAKAVIHKFFPEKVFDENELEKLTNHIARFSLSAIRGYTSEEREHGTCTS